jgi:hypothetical protein
MVLVRVIFGVFLSIIRVIGPKQLLCDVTSSYMTQIQNETPPITMAELRERESLFIVVSG